MDMKVVKGKIVEEVGVGVAAASSVVIADVADAATVMLADDETLYFAYGSNMDVEQMARRCPDARLLGVAFMKSFCLMVDAAGYMTISPSVRHSVHGALWAISADDERSLDGYEGVSSDCYRKEWREVRLGSGSVDALVYISNRGPAGMVSERVDYLERVRAAALSLELCEEAMRQIEAICASSGVAPLEGRRGEDTPDCACVTCMRVSEECACADEARNLTQVDRGLWEAIRLLGIKGYPLRSCCDGRDSLEGLRVGFGAKAELLGVGTVLSMPEGFEYSREEHSLAPVAIGELDAEEAAAKRSELLDSLVRWCRELPMAEARWNPMMGRV